MAKDYYKILGVEKGASKEDIKKAYKKMAKKYHPDISQEPDAEAKFKEVNEAASVLLDDEKKQRYDTYGSADGPQGFGGGFSGGGAGFDPRDFGINIEDIFEQFGFGDFGGFGSRRGSRRRKDTSIHEEITITLDDVYFGADKEIKVMRDDKCLDCDGKGAKKDSDISTCSECNGAGVVYEVQRSILGAIRTQRACPKCHGSGEEIKNPCSNCSGSGIETRRDTVKVKVPKGVEDGITLRIKEKGSYDRDTKSYGDLYLRVFVEDNKTYERDGIDLYRNMNINFIQAIIGDEVEFKHFDKTLSLKVPEGTQPETLLRLKGKGLPQLNGDSHGDLYVKIKVEIPEKASKEQKKILMEYAKTMKDKSFLDKLKGLFG